MAQSLTVQRLFEPATHEPAEFAAQPNSLDSMPTAEAYGYWQGAFNFFNGRLFRGKLPNVMITLTRHGRRLGCFCPRAFEDHHGRVAHEISMNPAWFAARGDRGSLSTFVHEMGHQWREDFGPLNRKGGKGRGGYHDVVWANRMEAIGLMPSNTGEPGGKRTGFQMTHYVIEGGRFDRACAELLAAGQFLNWRDNGNRHAPSPVTRNPAVAPVLPKNTRTRFVCVGCDLKAWARASARLSCTACNQPLLVR